MALELPLVSAVIARLPDPKIHLAAYGGIVFPLAILIEAPIIMLLAASTALCADWFSYRRIRFFMMTSGAVLTLVHIGVVFTPLYDVVALTLIQADEKVARPARSALMVMPLWTWAIAYRRFQQGVLIRFGHSGAVGVGTITRLVACAGTLATGYWLRLPGATAGALAVAVGVLVEAAYAGIRAQPVLRKQVREASPGEELTWRGFFAFYTPLAMTPFITILTQPLVSASLNRMPRSLDSLAVWPVLHGLGFVLRCLGMSYNEVVVAMVGVPGSLQALARFAILLAGATSAVLLLMAATPLADLWFGGVSSLPPDLVALAGGALWIAILLPGLTSLQSLYQGILVHRRKTRFITESMTAALLGCCAILTAGIVQGDVTGLYVGAWSYLGGSLVNTLWLVARSRETRRDLRRRDASMSPEEEGGTVVRCP